MVAEFNVIMAFCEGLSLCARGKVHSRRDAPRSHEKMPIKLVIAGKQPLSKTLGCFDGLTHVSLASTAGRGR
jgi:hypothetical protein